MKDKLVLLKAIRLILANLEDIKKESLSLQKKFNKYFSILKSNEEINSLVANKIISKYSFFASFIDDAIIPVRSVSGLGTVISTFGNSIAIEALLMKYLIEMTIAIATIYGHNIESEDEEKLCLAVTDIRFKNKLEKKMNTDGLTKYVGKKVKEFFALEKTNT